MNGVRRLLGAASTNSPPPNPEPTIPFSLVQKTGPSWPPVSVPTSPVRPQTQPSTPNTTRASFRKSGNTDPSWKRISGNLDTRDELLVSLMASEAVIDSREFAILGAEEVDELKKVSIRLPALH